LTILAGADLPPGTLIPLFRFCRVVRLDNVLTFRLEKRSLQQVPSAASAAEELRNALQPCAPWPSTVRQFLGDQRPPGGTVRFRFCRGLVNTDDPDLLTAIRSHPKLKGYLDRAAPPGYLMIKANADPRNFVLRCQEHGFKVVLF
jgi:hypothetical protein